MQKHLTTATSGKIPQLINDLRKELDLLTKTDLGVQKEIPSLVESMKSSKFSTREIEEMSKVNQDLTLFCSVLRQQDREIREEAQKKFNETLESLSTGDGEVFFNEVCSLMEKFNPAKKISPGE